MRPSQGVRHISSIPSTAMEAEAELQAGGDRLRDDARQPADGAGGGEDEQDKPERDAGRRHLAGPTWPVTSTAETAFIGCTAIGRP